MFAAFRRQLLPLALLCFSAVVTPLAAQVTDSVPPPLGGSLRLLSAQPIGEFKRYVNNGWGIGGDVRWFPGVQRVASLRLDAAYVNYGRQTTRECFGTGCRIQININTSNNIFSGVVGPELQVPSGPIRPYVNALAGWTVFWTQSSAEGANDEDDVFRTTNLRDNLLTAALGGGFRVPLRVRVKLDINARRDFNGRARYLTRDSFGDGTLTAPLVRESQVNMWMYSLGVAFGF